MQDELVDRVSEQRESLLEIVHWTRVKAGVRRPPASELVQ
jgi:hypothetical protein